MKIFHCDHCGQLVFFENVHCLSCGRALAYAPDVADVLSLSAGDDGLWHAARRGVEGRRYRLCANYDRESVCNWAVPADDPDPLCRSCRLTRTVPDLGVPGHKDAWYRLEVAKRRLVYSLLVLGLPVANKTADPAGGVVFDLLAEVPDAPVLTGHTGGVITINVAEADDAERERRRKQMHEPYRTLLGHFRHEIGHYYWDRLLAGDAAHLRAFRAAFGDERTDYGEALRRHYADGAPANWQERFISAYATSHPWEDWAETWAHYLHMIDALETAAACGLTLRPHRADEPSFAASEAGPHAPFDRKVAAWFPLTYVLNSLNRGLGLPDGYPFVLSGPVVEKLRFVDEIVRAVADAGDAPRAAGAETLV